MNTVRETERRIEDFLFEARENRRGMAPRGLDRTFNGREMRPRR